MTESSLSEWIAQRAGAVGFDLCGVVAAQKFPELANADLWLARGFAGEMNYLSDPRRRDPASVLPGVRSVIVCALNYNSDYPRFVQPHSASDDEAQAAPPRGSSRAPRGWISRYAWGDDYHDVLREKLETLLNELRQRCGDTFISRVYADTGPVQERVLAKYAGLGWLGKNTLLLNQKIGSYFFLGVILTTLEIPPSLDANSVPSPDLCGSCRRCIEACPTDALLEPYIMDARRCISYLTIELRGSVPEDLREPIGNHVFGCDICQDVCPWNNRAPITGAAQFAPRNFPSSSDSTASPDPPQSLYRPDLLWLVNLTEEEFRQRFRGSPIKRAKWRGLVRNACIAMGNAEVRGHAARHAEIVSALTRLSESSDIHIAESAQWALSRIQSKEREPQDG
jgi:epoxyqueuosine reductase